MTLTEARETIKEDSALSVDWLLAAGTLTSTKESTLEDLLACLRRRGAVASVAATALYVRTKRPTPKGLTELLSADHEDWTQYLRERGLTKQA